MATQQSPGRPRTKSRLSFGSTRSRRSSGSIGKLELTESPKEKSARRMTSKANPTTAMTEAQPGLSRAIYVKGKRLSCTSANDPFPSCTSSRTIHVGVHPIHPAPRCSWQSHKYTLLLYKIYRSWLMTLQLILIGPILPDHGSSVLWTQYVRLRLPLTGAIPRDFQQDKVRKLPATPTTSRNKILIIQQ